MKKKLLDFLFFCIWWISIVFLSKTLFYILSVGVYAEGTGNPTDIMLFYKNNWQVTILLSLFSLFFVIYKPILDVGLEITNNIFHSRPIRWVEKMLSSFVNKY